MNKIEFLDEVKKSRLYFSDFPKIYADFNLFQNEALDTLNEFHRVCCDYEITYTLAYGSMLGAVRDNGQIPWDYDIDVFVPIDEKQKLINALNDSLNNLYYFKCAEVDSKCRHFMIRISPKKYSTEVIHVDVFFLCGCPEDEFNRNIYANQIYKYSKIRYYQFKNILKNGINHPKALLFDMFPKFLSFFYNKEYVYCQIKALIEKYSAFHSKYCIHADIFAKDYLFLSKDIWDTIDIEFDNGYRFKISKNYDMILTSMYGNYKKIPKLEDRVNEVILHHNIIMKSVNKKAK